MYLESNALTYLERSKLCKNPTVAKLFAVMEEKRSNLSLAADLTTKEEILFLAENVGPHICVLKTHIDIIEDFDETFIGALKRLSEKYHFMIFEDRKFADIGNTVKAQYQKGIYRISDWADIINAHSVPGPGLIRGLKEVGMPSGRGLLLLAEMSSEGTLANNDYTERTVEMAEEHNDFVIGFIARRKLSEDPRFIHFTPGVSFESKGDSLGQRYLTPKEAIGRAFSDIVIVGRGIISSDNPSLTAEQYKYQAWEAYESRLNVQALVK